jgi:hypothetical protein
MDARRTANLLRLSRKLSTTQEHGRFPTSSVHLSRSKRRGLREYGLSASVYVADFDAKWIRRDVKREEILGTPNIQALADLANSYSIVRGMRPVPFSLNNVVQQTIATVLPLLPLLLTIMPLEEIVDRLFKILVP